MTPDGGISDRLVLGTAQLGMEYGVANKSGRPAEKEARAIVSAAWEAGIRTFDTAQAYGHSEAVLGRALRDLDISGQARIITKIDLPADSEVIEGLREVVEESMSRLDVSRLYGLLWHREQILDRMGEELQTAMADLVREGLVQHWGISLYSPFRAFQALDAGAFDILQVPASVMDHRFADAGVFNRAMERAVQIHLRSIFLQGLLLLDSSRISPRMEFAAPLIAAFSALSREMSLTPREAAFAYVKSRYPRASIIFGAERADQVHETAMSWKISLTDEDIARLEREFSGIDESVVDPTRWPD